MYTRIINKSIMYGCMLGELKSMQYLCWRIWNWYNLIHSDSGMRKLLNADGQILTIKCIWSSAQHSISRDQITSWTLTTKLMWLSLYKPNIESWGSHWRLNADNHWLLTTKMLDHHHNMMTVEFWHKLSSIGWSSVWLDAHSWTVKWLLDACKLPTEITQT